MNIFPMPIEFITSLVSLTWEDILWGYERKLLGWKDVIYLSKKRKELSSFELNHSSLEEELSSLEKENASRVGELLITIVSSKAKQSNSQSKEKWLFLILSWLFENRFLFDDPFEKIEEVYADFDYPEEMDNFVGYMPPRYGYDPLKHTKEENICRLYDEWRKYLVSAKNNFDLSQR